MAEETNIILSIKADTSQAAAGVDDLNKKIGNLNDTPIDKPFKTFKAEIKEAINEAKRLQEQFGNNSTEFANAAQRVADLRDRMGEFNSTVQSFDPDNRLQALVSVGQAGVASIQGVAGAMTLLGINTDSVNESIAKLQALSALSDSLSSIDNIRNAFTNFNSVIQSSTTFQKLNAVATTVTSVAMRALGISTTTTSTGFRILKGAIIGTGIGALVIGLVALVQNFDAVKKAVLNLIPGLGKVADFIGGIINAVTDFVGATSEAGRATDKLIKDTEKALKAGEEFLDANGDKYDAYTQRKIKADLEYKKHFLEVNKDEAKSDEEKQSLIQQYAAKRNRELDKADADRAAKVKEDNDKALEEEKKKAEDLKRIKDEADRKASEAAKKAKEQRDKIEANRVEQEKITSKLILDARLAGIENEFFKKQQTIEISKQGEIDSQLDLLNKKLIKEEEYQIRKKAIEDRYAFEQSALLVQKAADDEAAKQKAIDDAKAARVNALTDKATTSEAGVVTANSDNAPVEEDPAEVAKQKLAAILAAELQAEQDAFNLKMEQANGNQAQEELALANHLAKKKSLEQAYATAVKQIDQAALQAKQAQVTAIGNLLGQAAEVVGKHTVAGKALAVAQTTIQTYQSAMSAYAGMTSTIPGPVGIALGVVAAGLSVATGIANIKKILAVKVPAKGDSGGGLPSAASIGAAPSITAAATQQQSIQDARVTSTQGQQQPIKAYIVNSDLKDNDQKNKFLNSVSTF